MSHFLTYLFLGLLTEIVVGPVCYHFGGISPEGGGDFLGLIYVFVHFPLYLAATEFQLSASQWDLAAFATYPFLWAGLWFSIVWLVRRKKQKEVDS